MAGIYRFANTSWMMEEYMQCPYCKEEIKEGAIKCKHCGEILQKDQYNKTENVLNDYAGEKPVFAELFDIYDKNGGKFVLTGKVVNVWALIFGILWYIAKGLWLKAFLYIVLIAITSALTGGIALLFWLFYLIVMGPYDYYLLKVKGKHLW